MAADICYRSIFISDVHLGSSDCQAELLLEFLQSTESKYLYLVGDIIDIWKLKQSVYWPQVNSEVVRTIIDKAKNGTEVIYIPGNHDEMFRDLVGSEIHGIKLLEEAEHTTANGQRLLILHGDIFDSLVRNFHWLEDVGDFCYSLIMCLNRIQNKFRKLFGYSYWSFAAFIKYKFKEAVEYINKYEATVAQEASLRGVDGVVCGHIHHPNKLELDGIQYLNTGDWVEHCTALTEDLSGNIHLVNWLEAKELQAAVSSEQVEQPIEDNVRAA